MEDELNPKELYHSGKKPYNYKKSTGRERKKPAFDKTFVIGLNKQGRKDRGCIIFNIKRYLGKKTANSSLQKKYGK